MDVSRSHSIYGGDSLESFVAMVEKPATTLPPLGRPLPRGLLEPNLTQAQTAMLLSHCIGVDGVIIAPTPSGHEVSIIDNLK
jgi:hypothetical protein